MNNIDEVEKQLAALSGLRESISALINNNTDLFKLILSNIDEYTPDPIEKLSEAEKIIQKTMDSIISNHQNNYKYEADDLGASLIRKLLSQNDTIADAKIPQSDIDQLHSLKTVMNRLDSLSEKYGFKNYSNEEIPF